MESEIERRELANALDAFLDTLSPKKRSVFISRYWYAESVSAIAEKHGMSDGAVSMLLSRLCAKLHNYLSERGFEP